MDGVVKKKGSRLRRWYEIPKTTLASEELTEIEDSLVIQSTMPDYITGKIPPPIKVYLEDEQQGVMLLPKHFGMTRFGAPETDEQIRGEDHVFEFVGELKPFLDQHVAHATIMDALRSEIGTAYLALPPGGGKTVLALKAVAELGKRALVIVGAEHIMEQWEARANQYLPLTRVGTMQQGKINVEGCGIVVCMLQSLLSRGYSDIIDRFGFVIFDEAHHLNAPTFSTALQMLTCRYMLALSGTPYRKGGLDKVVKAFVGPVTFASKKKYVFPVMLKTITPEYEPQQDIFMRNGRYNLSAMISELLCIPERNKRIIQELANLCDDERSTLVLSLRVKHALHLREEFVAEFPLVPTFVFTGATPKSERSNLAQYRIIFSTFQMCGDAVDIPTLDCVFLVAPVVGQTEQAVNRGCRGDQATRSPMVVDVIDSHKKWKLFYYQRRAYYQRENFVHYHPRSPLKETTLSVSKGPPTQGSEATVATCSF